MNPFIRLLGSSLDQWTIVRLNGREELKQSLQVRLGEALLPLGGEVRLGGALLRLGRPKSAKTLGSGPTKQSSKPRRGLVRLSVGVPSRTEMTGFSHFHKNSFNQNKSFQNKTTKLT